MAAITSPDYPGERLIVCRNGEERTWWASGPALARPVDSTDTGPAGWSPRQAV
jgi:hypothetical protein